MNEFGIAGNGVVNYRIDPTGTGVYTGSGVFSFAAVGQPRDSSSFPYPSNTKLPLYVAETGWLIFLEGNFPDMPLITDYFAPNPVYKSFEAAEAARLTFVDALRSWMDGVLSSRLEAISYENDEGVSLRITYANALTVRDIAETVIPSQIFIDITDDIAARPLKIIGSPQPDQLSGWDQPDTIEGGDGNDYIRRTGLGDDLLYGQDGDDTILSEIGHDTLLGGKGDDILVGSDVENLIYGESGNDAAGGKGGDDTLFGNEGNDVLRGGDDQDSLIGGSGNDTLMGDFGDDTLDGGDGDDWLYGGENDDMLMGGKGTDRLWGFAGKNTLTGGADGDYLYGGTGIDVLDGRNDANDVGVVTDVLFGGAEKDLFYLDHFDEIADFDYGELAWFYTRFGVDHVVARFDGQQIIIRAFDVNFSGSDEVIIQNGFSTRELNIAVGTGPNAGSVVFDRVPRAASSDPFAETAFDPGKARQITVAQYAPDLASVALNFTSDAARFATDQGVGTFTVMNYLLKAKVPFSAIQPFVTDLAKLMPWVKAATFVTGASKLAYDVLSGKVTSTTEFAYELGKFLASLIPGKHFVGTTIALAEEAFKQVMANVEGAIAKAFNLALAALPSLTVSETSRFDGSDEPDFVISTREGDVIRTNGGNDHVSTGRGPSTNALGATDGNDTFDGGDGNDTIDYGSAESGVVIDLSTGTAHGAATGSDQVTEFENVTGSDYADRIVGTAADNALSGIGGNDILVGGAGVDTLDGGHGTDAVDYSTSDAGVIVDLSGGPGSGGHAEGDQLIDIEAVIGSHHGDRLLGSVAANVLQGGGGNDTLIGGAADGPYDLESALVARMYLAALGREADADGHKVWTNRMIKGMQPETLAENFMDSPEFDQRYGATGPSEFVTLLYQNALGREPDAKGLAIWINQLDSGAMTRAEVLFHFADSREFKNNTEAYALSYSREMTAMSWTDDVYRLYEAALHRPPGRAGITEWTTRLAEGASLATIADGFLQSREFKMLYPESTAGDYVTLLYRNALGRDPDSKGYAAWVKAIEDGTISRRDALIHFSQSPELQLKSGPRLDAWMHSAGTDDILIGGTGSNVLFGGMLSDEFRFHTGAASTNDVVGLETWDELQFNGFGYGSAAEVKSHMTEMDGNVVFFDQGVTVTLLDITLADITDDMVTVF